MSFLCEKCNKACETQRGLKHHLFYCNEKNLVCEYCSKELCNKQSFSNHIKTCKQKNQTNSEAVEKLTDENQKLQKSVEDLTQELEKLKADSINFHKINPEYQRLSTELPLLQKLLREKDERIEELKSSFNSSIKTINNVASKSGNTYNQINNHNKTLNYLRPIGKDDFEKITSNILDNHDLINEKQFARLCMESGLKNKVIKTDHSRKVITYVDEEGNQIKDPKAKELTENIYKSTKTAFKEKYKQYEKFNDYQDQDRLDFYQNIVTVDKGSMEKFGEELVKEANKNVESVKPVFKDLREMVRRSAYWLFHQGPFGIGEWVFGKIEDKIYPCKPNISLKKKYIIIRETNEKIENKELKEGLKYALNVENFESLILEQSLNRPEDKSIVKENVEMCKLQYATLFEKDKSDDWDNIIIGMLG